MKFLIDLFPVVVFFAAYHQRDMFYATGAVMIACAIQTIGYRLFAGSFDRNHVMAILLVLPFGALTLVFRDPTFIKWNGTVELWLLAVGLIGSQYIGDKPMIERMLGSGFELPQELWRKLNIVWATFFAFSGACNLYVAYQFEEETWVNFRLFGMTGMSLVFVAANMLWILRVAPEPDTIESSTSTLGSTDPTPDPSDEGSEIAPTESSTSVGE
jgi:intracellular septation protein